MKRKVFAKSWDRTFLGQSRLLNDLKRVDPPCACIKLSKRDIKWTKEDTHKYYDTGMLVWVDSQP